VKKNVVEEFATEEANPIEEDSIGTTKSEKPLPVR
jgi:hypothetical protein